MNVLFTFNFHRTSTGIDIDKITQQIFTCSKSTTETLEKRLTYLQN